MTDRKADFEQRKARAVRLHLADGDLTIVQIAQIVRLHPVSVSNAITRHYAERRAAA